MQITTFRMIYLTFVNEYDPWPGAPTFRTFQLPELIADTLTGGPRSSPEICTPRHHFYSILENNHLFLMSENTQNHKNRLLDLEGTFCEKHEKSQKVRIRLTLPGTDKSTFCCDFGIPKNPTRDKCLPAGTQKWRYRCL